MRPLTTQIFCFPINIWLTSGQIEKEVAIPRGN